MASAGYEASIIAANKRAHEHGIDLSKLPKLNDMSAANITENVHKINQNCPDERTKFIFKNLVQHLHDFSRETSITTEEWMTALNFLAETGKMCSDIRHEFILLSDTLGLSILVDGMNNAKPPGATEGTVLGPFFTEDAKHIESGDSIASEGKGDYMYVHGKILDTKGNPIAGATIDTWETDGNGMYDTQYENRDHPDCRGRITSGKDGSYAYRAVVPVSYPIPSDGPIGKMVRYLGRHVMRPAHLHVMIEAPGYEKLVTALYPRNDPYISSDAVFGVKSSLIVDLKPVDDTSVTLARGFKEAKPHQELKFDFILATSEECQEARRKSMPASTK
ncbi:hypothetical protein V5O48_002509 [Marasmius crinis-equi]|uniref:Intradiol ring-cleavage dioxygenase n=1 Tax=Marasmius crinis-equi TaxID=585013 RepID=A0ABR3FVW8_9AGAR